MWPTIAATNLLSSKAMPTTRNIFACLVHEQPECVIDLVRNLHHLDPTSQILLYNGGSNHQLLNHGFPFGQYSALAHPQPRLLRWGRLHDFALDCMRFALDNFAFDTLTIVDSDQLATRPGYSAYLGSFLAPHPRVGMLGNAPTRQPSSTQVGPAVAALREVDLWRPWLRRFPAGEEKFVHWTFWPSTVFTADAARDLVQIFATDTQLQTIMRRTRIWATEEVILPTLVALLGYEIAANPCSYEYVRYRAPYSLSQIGVALAHPDVFWLHPIARRYDDPLRRHVRTYHDQYASLSNAGGAMTTTDRQTAPLLLTVPILTRMKQVEGWLEEDEADLLIAATTGALTGQPDKGAVVEIGSYCGRSTVVLGSVVKTLHPTGQVYAIDPHDGKVGALDQGLSVGRPTLEKFTRNIAAAGLNEIVQPIQQYSYEVVWDQPISLLLIDGLHDYANVARDFHHFERWVLPGGYIAFHDYASYYPGVQSFVNEVLATGHYRQVALVRSMIVVEKLAGDETEGKEADAQPAQAAAEAHSVIAATRALEQPIIAAPPRHNLSQRRTAASPLVSCIMPTCDRRQFVPQAIAYFLRQDYLNRELIVVDDGADSVADLMPADPRVRYIRLPRKHVLGDKRNIACRAAQGEIIAHWDDDDWIAPWRIDYQMRQLEATRADLCGLSTLLFYAPGANTGWQYIYSDAGQPWVAGGTLCYRKAFWQAHPFANIAIGEDARFVWSHGAKRVVALERHDFYVALIHPRNTSPKRTTDARWHAYPAGDIRRLLGADAAFYAPLAAAVVSVPDAAYT